MSSYELSRFIRVLSKNTSIRQNLDLMYICMFDIYDQDFLHNLLKTKSYGFAKLKIEDMSTKDQIIPQRFEVSARKISKVDMYCIL